MAKRKQVKPADGTWGQGSVRQRGDRWQVRWREGEERKSTSGFLSRAEAVEELERIQARLALGQPGATPKIATVKPSGPGPLPELVEDWLEHRRAHGIRTVDEDRARWALHLAAPLETQTLTSVTPKWVRELASSLVKPPLGTKAPDGTKKQGISGATAHRVLTLLSGFYAWAVDGELVVVNPARAALRNKDVKRLMRSRYDKGARRYLKTWAEVDRLYAAVKKEDPTVAIYYLLGARAGLRPGEALALRWGDVDLDARTMRVRRQVRSGKEGPTKSGKPREVPIGETLAKELASWRGTKVPVADTDLVCPPPHRIKKNGTAGKAWGKYLGPKSVDPAMDAAYEKAEIEPADVYDYGRRTFGSIMGLDPAVSVWRLQSIMGHADIKTTERYVSLRDQALAPTELRALG